MPVETLRPLVPAGSLACADVLLGLGRGSADARRHVTAESGGLRDRPFDRPAGSELHDGEINQQDAEQGRHDQQQAAQDVTGHGALSPAARRALL
jgi:hypothetical protein